MADRTLSRDLLKILSEAVGVSGDESEVRSLIIDRIRPHVTDLTVDVMGNLIACRKGTGESDLRVLVSAPMDEIGFMVYEVDDGGLIHVMPIGAIDFRYVPARPVWVGAQKLPGVLIWTPIHLREGSGIVDPEDMLIDIGASGKGIPMETGDRVAFCSSYAQLGESVVRGKAFDSRVGCAALIALIESDPLSFDLYVAFTAQSKIGGRGVGVAANRIDPHLAITLTGTAADDTPVSPDSTHVPAIRLGGGPTISTFEGRIPLSPRLRAHISRIADAAQIPLQIDVTPAPPAQAYALSRARSGIPTALIGVPIRYPGSPNALIDLHDADRMLTLLQASLSALTPQTLAFED